MAPAAIVLLALSGIVRWAAPGSATETLVAIRNAPAMPSPGKELVFDNLGCRFKPHAAVLTVGSTLVVTNSDAVLHTTHYYGPSEANISLPIAGMRTERKLTRPGLYVVKCDIHGWMQAFIRVDEHPYHGVTDASGRFRIEGVPTGRYTLEVWHERLGTLAREVVIDAAGDSEITIEYGEEVDP